MEEDWIWREGSPKYPGKCVVCNEPVADTTGFYWRKKTETKQNAIMHKGCMQAYVAVDRPKTNAIAQTMSDPYLALAERHTAALEQIALNLGKLVTQGAK